MHSSLGGERPMTRGGWDTVGALSIVLGTGLALIVDNILLIIIFYSLGLLVMLYKGEGA